MISAVALLSVSLLCVCVVLAAVRAGLIGLIDLCVFFVGSRLSKARQGVAAIATNKGKTTMQASQSDEADKTSNANTTDTTDDTMKTKMVTTMVRPRTQ